MRTEEEVIERLKEVWHKSLDKKKLEFLSCGYKNCIYNIKCRVRGNGNICFCSNVNNTDIKTKQILVCNNDEIAKNCQYYKCKNTEDEIVKEFREEIKNPSICGQKYPKLAVLLWFMQRVPEIDSDNLISKVKSFFKR